MRKSLISLLLILPLAAADLEFKEAFADPATRQAALSKLVPQTRDWFFYYALHQQLSGQTDAYNKTMEAWKASFSWKIPVSSEGFDILENRELLIRFDADPRKAADELIRRLNLTFNDAKPDARADEKLPDRLDPAMISAEAFEKAANVHTSQNAYRTYSQARLLDELDRIEAFDEVKLRFFHRALERADHPGIVRMITRNLQLALREKFGSVKIHGLLTRAQMDELLAALPTLRNDEAFAVRYLATLLPGAETHFDLDPAAHAAHLVACRDFVATLPPALNSLKAHVLYHHLRLQRDLGQYPQEDFMAYLRLPRLSHSLLLPAGGVGSKTVLETGKDFHIATACPPIGNDEPLIRDYLQHFLGTVDTAEMFKDLIEEKLLRSLHARARLLAGGDPVRWGAELNPADVRELQSQTRIRFAPGQPMLLDAGTAVKLSLDLKNTPELVVRIFELDLPEWVEREGSEPPVDLDLEGLVPHSEKRLRFETPPLVIHREVLDLPELEGAGAWIVECISRGVASRALIRKGRLIPYLESQARGQGVRVFDEKGNLLRDAIVAIGTETFSPGADGSILIPDMNSSTRNDAIVRQGKLAVAMAIAARREDISLDARFHIDREQLLADKEANLHLQLRLNSHGHEIPLEWIDKPTLTLEAAFVDGTKSERVIGGDLKLSPSMNVPFQVPANTTALRLTLAGSVTPRDGDDPVPLQAQMQYRLNGILSTGRIGAGLFTKDTTGYRLEVRGRNGEPLPSRPISFQFYHQDFTQILSLLLRTDEKGLVSLGQLPGIARVLASGTDIVPVSLLPGSNSSSIGLPTHFHLSANEEIRLPLSEEQVLDRSRISLIETRESLSLRDHFDKLAIENGQLVVRGLPAGDFLLGLGRKTIPIKVSAGAPHNGLIVSTARILPRHLPSTPYISRAEVEGGTLVINVAGAAPGTRVSLAGRRFFHDWPAGNALQPFADPEPDTLVPSFTGNAFLETSRLSDEVRYILERRAAKTYPGSLLPRPGLLVNRWSEEDLVQDKQSGEEGASGSVSGKSGGGNRIDAPRPPTESSSVGGSEGPCIDYLATSSVVRHDLQVAADGTVRVPAGDFVTCQYVEVIAADASSKHQRILPLVPSDLSLRDRRLARPLDVAKYHVGTRRAAALAKGAEASIESMIEADWRAFTTLAEAHAFLAGASGDPNLEKFRPLLEWPSLDEAAKLAFLSEHACHELHLFLARKDRAFFDKHVKPLLAEKKQPTVIDNILLSRDLTAYLRPYAWLRLNAAEKALLSQAMPELRQRISTELGQRWELEAPTPEQETILFAETLGGGDLSMEDSLGLASRTMGGEGAADYGAVSGASRLLKQLQSIVVPQIDFEDTTVEEAIQVLRRYGVNFVIRRPRTGGGDSLLDADAAGGLGDAADPGALRIKELKLRNVPLAEALKYICEQTKLRYKVDDHSVTLVPATETDEDLFTRSFRVPRDLPRILAGGDSQEGDPFGTDEAGQGPKVLAPRKSIETLLMENGVKFPDGSNARFFPQSGTLLVRNTPTNLDLLEQIIEQVGIVKKDELEDDPFAESAPAAPSALAGAAADPFGGGGAGVGLGFTARPSWSSERDQTRLWRESNYFRYHGATDESFIALNRFWLDLAAWDGKGIFISPHFNACTRTANEALFCLAMLDLPFKAGRPETRVDGTTLRVKAKEPMLLFYKDTRETQKVAADSPVLVRQTFHRLDDQFHTEDGRKIENNITGNFMPGVPYGASMIVTNPSGAGRRIDVLAQIPAGSIPLDSGDATESTTRELEPYGVLTLRLAFYFPMAGEFPIYPMQVSEGDLILARSEDRVLKVTAEAPALDANSWPAMARDASDEEVLARLRTANLKTLDLKLILWRLKNPGFFQKTTEILRERLYYSGEIASYALFHADTSALRDTIENSPQLRKAGEWFDSTLLKIRPAEHNGWEAFEFDPLVNPRAHRFADKERLTHPEALKHFESFLDILSWKPSLSAEDQLALTAHLLLQDRIDEALTRFDAINPADLTSRMAYDYMRSVVMFHRSQPEEAKAIAQRYPDLPQGLWKDRFAKVIAQADEIVALRIPRKPEEVRPKEEAPSLDLALAADGKLMVKRHKVDKTLLQLFSVDLEVMFSKDPFLTGDGAVLPGIRANETREVTLTAEETSVELPENFRKGNVLVSAKSGATKVLKVLDSRALETIRQPEERTLQVHDSAGRLPLPQCYVKVYVEGRNGEATFHKDGYTDLRGKFDYLSHTGSEIGEIRRISVLISHPEKGARIEVFDL